MIRLAVTGLSRAGKTVFITALIQNLLALAANKDVLPQLTRRLTDRGENRLRSRHPPAARRLGSAALRSGGQARRPRRGRPAWPDRTNDIAQISLALTLTRRSPLGQKLGERRVRLDILDYPGEWLLDLPMLTQSFAQWSAQTLSLLRESPRRGVSAAPSWPSSPTGGPVTGSRRSRPGGPPALQGAHWRPAGCGMACATCSRAGSCARARAAMCPCSGSSRWMSGPRRCHDGSLMALLSDRFEAYKRDMRTSFFDTHFRGFDRQVLLVDVLGALHAGRAAFHDTARAIRDIATALRYGAPQGLVADATAGMLHGAAHVLPAPLARASQAAAERLGGSRIGRVVFVATKADHVPALKRDTLRHLLRALSGQVEGQQQAAGATVSYQVAAALRATEDGSALLDGRPVQVVKGRILGEDKVRPFHVGDVPVAMPPDDFWGEGFFEMPRFRPPLIDASGGSGLPHLGLDVVLDDLLGDLL